jgi:hypothetical protein
LWNFLLTIIPEIVKPVNGMAGVNYKTLLTRWEFGSDYLQESENEDLLTPVVFRLSVIRKNVCSVGIAAHIALIFA